MRCDPVRLCKFKCVEGPPSIVGMKQRRKEAVWWPNMNAQVEQFVSVKSVTRVANRASLLAPSSTCNLVRSSQAQFTSYNSNPF